MKKIRASYKPWNSVSYTDFHKGRDNKWYYNSSGAPCSSGYKVRVPSLRDGVYTWRNFYKLFPYIKECLMSGESVRGFVVKSIELVGDVYVVRQERNHSGVGYRIRTMKFKKIW